MTTTSFAVCIALLSLPWCWRAELDPPEATFMDGTALLSVQVYKSLQVCLCMSWSLLSTGRASSVSFRCVLTIAMQVA